jgi:hypothetical protein
MTNDEKNVAKEMNRYISELIYLKAVYEAVLGTCAPDWRQQVQVARASVPFQEHRRRIDEAREAVDLLIDRDEFAAVRLREVN